MKVAAIILAGGRGTRINSNKFNKVTLPFLGKPLIHYGVELFTEIANPIVVVIGAFSQSVKAALKNFSVIYALQRKRLGTGHAVKVGLDKLKSSPPDLVLVGYGDHLMFYKKETVRKMIKLHRKQKSSVTILTTNYSNPDELAWGRIIRDSKGKIIGSIEQKDASKDQRKITEVNPNFNCFDYRFLRDNIKKIKKSKITGEFYLPDLIKLAFEQNKKVSSFKVPFKEVGIGINRVQELSLSENLHLQH